MEWEFGAGVESGEEDDVREIGQTESADDAHGPAWALPGILPESPQAGEELREDDYLDDDGVGAIDEVVELGGGRVTVVAVGVLCANDGGEE